MKTYSFGIETVPTALDGDLLAGSVHDGRNYKIMLARLDKEEIKELGFLSGENDWEGHSVAKLDGDYLIGGAVEGVATPDGGNGWKAYVARLDKSLNVIWERKLKILGNEALYSILPDREGAFITGETSNGRDRGFFIGRITLEGEVLWLRKLGLWSDAVISSLIELGGKPVLVGSLKEEKWGVKAFEFTGNGELVAERELADGTALTAAEIGGKIIVGGYRGSDLWVWSESWEATLPNGVVTSLLPVESGLLGGGEVEGKAVVIKLDPKGEILWKRELWERGWVEVLSKSFALGVREEEGKTVMVASKFLDPIQQPAIDLRVSKNLKPEPTT
ncbi:hypothetical protein [Thermococcus sp.]|uniref:hypothetical protein n=1 Tax=Thermococcus sp. TaxID=35749 RepID=UPI002607EF79|nr:hypothetical protein [Thermococcus sp.]